MATFFVVPATAEQAAPLYVDNGRTNQPGSRYAGWANQNRFLEVSVGQRRQDYKETDAAGLTSDGVLDTETGTQGQIGFALRWQTDAGWLFHLYAQRQSGITDYNGYLQTGNGSLTPLRGSTGNIATQFGANIGYAFNARSWNALPDDWQVTPLVQVAHHQWDRNLAQYSEANDFASYAVGTLLQWRVRPGTMLEAQALLGRTQSASVNASSLGFAASQPGGNLHELQVGISQDLGALTGKDEFSGWRLAACYLSSRYEFSASQLVNGLQAPPNQSRPSSWMVGLQRQF